MVLQIFADARQVMHDRDAARLQERSAAHTRELEQLRALQRARGEQHLARRARLVLDAVLTIAHTNRACTFHHESGGLRFGFNP